MSGDIPIARGRFQKKRQSQSKSFRTNDRIRITPVRLVDENDGQVGVVPVSEALRMAREAGLDLVEVAPNAKPPVCRIIDYGKWKYQQKKREQKAKTKTKLSELKEVRLRPGTDDHDLKIKTDRARKFLAAGHKVQFTILFRGRQMAHRNIGFQMYDRIVELYADVAHVDLPPRVQGRRMTMIVAPGVKVVAPKPAPSDAAPTPPKPDAAPATDETPVADSAPQSAETPAADS